MAWVHPSKYPPSSSPVSLSLPPPDRDVHRLVFPAVGPQHAGVYKSVIANKLGKAACYAHLYVTGEANTPLVSHVQSLTSSQGEGGASALYAFPFAPRGAIWPCSCPYSALHPQPTALRLGDPMEPLGPKNPANIWPVAFRCGSGPPRWCAAGGGCDREDDCAHMEPSQESGHGHRWVSVPRSCGEGRETRTGRLRRGHQRSQEGWQGPGRNMGRAGSRARSSFVCHPSMCGWHPGSRSASGWSQRQRGHHILYSFSEGLGAWVMILGIPSSSLGTLSMLQFPYLR